MAGAVIGTLEDMTQVRLVGLKDMTGAVLSAQDANLVMRGLKTLELRMERHCDNAEKIADFLEKHPKVEKVFYPGLESDPHHKLAKKQMDRFGGMIAFELKGGIEEGRKLMNGLNMITRAVSLGDAETLIQHPASMTHSTYTAEERAEYQITDGLIRLSAGLESIDDILADLSNALDGDQMAIAAE